MPKVQPSIKLSIKAKLAKALLALLGWRVVSAPPIAAKGVVIIYPHTSNWDFLIGVLARAVLQLPMHWIGKDTLFRWPFGGIMRALGGTPVDRSKPHGLVNDLRKELERHQQYYVVITPEGTRKRTDHWKSGFYHLATDLRIPVGLAFIDYSRREVGIATWLELAGDSIADLARIRNVYRERRGRHPELAGEIRFQEKK